MVKPVSIYIISFVLLSTVVLSVMGIETGATAWLSDAEEFTRDNVIQVVLSVCGLYICWLVYKNKLIGKKLLSVFYAVQVPYLVSPSFYINYNTGLTLSIKSSATVSIHQVPYTYQLGVNFIALILFIFSIRILNRHKYLLNKTEK